MVARKREPRRWTLQAEIVSREEVVVQAVDEAEAVEKFNRGDYTIENPAGGETIDWKKMGDPRLDE